MLVWGHPADKQSIWELAPGPPGLACKSSACPTTPAVSRMLGRDQCAPSFSLGMGGFRDRRSMHWRWKSTGFSSSSGSWLLSVDYSHARFHIRKYFHVFSALIQGALSIFLVTWGLTSDYCHSLLGFSSLQINLWPPVLSFQSSTLHVWGKSHLPITTLTNLAASWSISAAFSPNTRHDHLLLTRDPSTELHPFLPPFLVL